MAATRTPGITIDTDGRRFIDKRYRGVRIGMRVGPVTQDKAEERLQSEIHRVELELAERAHPRPLFRDCAARYLAQSHDKRSLEAIRVHVRLLMRRFGELQPQHIHDATLAPFIAERRAAGVSPTTINRTLEIARTILNRAARSYRDQDGHPLLNAIPPLIAMVPEARRPPYPITWEEQDRLFPTLPAHLQRMALFAVNTGLRNSNVCGLQWTWEVFVPEVGRSVFVIPPEAFKSKRAHVAILNDAAWSIVQAQRGLDPIWVFPFRGRPIGTMNSNGWQRARDEKLVCNPFGFTICAIHLRAASARQVFRWRIVRHCLDTPRIRWLDTMRAPTSGA
jgi:integrase